MLRSRARSDDGRGCPDERELERYVLGLVAGYPGGGEVRSHVLHCRRCSALLARLVVFYDVVQEELRDPVSESALVEALRLEGRSPTVVRLCFHPAPNYRSNGRQVFVRTEGGPESGEVEAEDEGCLTLSLVELDDGDALLTYSGPRPHRRRIERFEIPGSDVRISFERDRVVFVPSRVREQLTSATRLLAFSSEPALFPAQPA